MSRGGNHESFKGARCDEICKERPAIPNLRTARFSSAPLNGIPGYAANLDKYGIAADRVGWIS